MNGSVNIANNAERFEELKRGVSMAKVFGLEAEIISPQEAADLWPLMNANDIVGAVWLPGDGRTNPVDTTMALAKGARQGGATIMESVAVTGIHQNNGRVSGVATEQGDIQCEIIVNCAGMWGRELGKLAGVNVPLHAAEHYYLVTEPLEGMHKDLPILRDPGGYTYYREEVGALLAGFFEPNAVPWGMKGDPCRCRVYSIESGLGSLESRLRCDDAPYADHRRNWHPYALQWARELYTRCMLITWVKHQNSRISMWRLASIQSGFSHQVVLARCWPNG